MPDSPRKRRQSLTVDIEQKVPKEKKKYDDYEIQELRKKKSANFSKDFLRSVKFVKDKKTKRAYMMKTVIHFILKKNDFEIL